MPAELRPEEHVLALVDQQDTDPAPDGWLPYVVPPRQHDDVTTWTIDVTGNVGVVTPTQ